jgi:hypothetical protein
MISYLTSQIDDLYILYNSLKSIIDLYHPFLIFILFVLFAISVFLYSIYFKKYDCSKIVYQFIFCFFNSSILFLILSGNVSLLVLSAIFGNYEHSLSFLAFSIPLALIHYYTFVFYKSNLQDVFQKSSKEILNNLSTLHFKKNKNLFRILIILNECGYLLSLSCLIIFSIIFVFSFLMVIIINLLGPDGIFDYINSFAISISALGAIFSAYIALLSYQNSKKIAVREEIKDLNDDLKYNTEIISALQNVGQHISQINWELDFLMRLENDDVIDLSHFFNNFNKIINSMDNLDLKSLKVEHDHLYYEISRFYSHLKSIIRIFNEYGSDIFLSSEKLNGDISKSFQDSESLSNDIDLLVQKLEQSKKDLNNNRLKLKRRLY